MDRTGQVTWRAWLGTGDNDTMEQLDVAEFDNALAAREWVEDRLTVGWPRPVFGSIDRGEYCGCRWLPDLVYGLDADVVDGRVSWRRPGPSR
jgi:hypothetical protein